MATRRNNQKKNKLSVGAWIMMILVLLAILAWIIKILQAVNVVGPMPAPLEAATSFLANMAIAFLVGLVGFMMLPILPWVGAVMLVIAVGFAVFVIYQTFLADPPPITTGTGEATATL